MPSFWLVLGALHLLSLSIRSRLKSNFYPVWYSFDVLHSARHARTLPLDSEKGVWTHGTNYDRG